MSALKDKMEGILCFECQVGIANLYIEFMDKIYTVAASFESIDADSRAN